MEAIYLRTPLLHRNGFRKIAARIDRFKNHGNSKGCASSFAVTFETTETISLSSCSRTHRRGKNGDAMVKSIEKPNWNARRSVRRSTYSFVPIMVCISFEFCPFCPRRFVRKRKLSSLLCHALDFGFKTRFGCGYFILNQASIGRCHNAR